MELYQLCGWVYLQSYIAQVLYTLTISSGIHNWLSVYVYAYLVSIPVCFSLFCPQKEHFRENGYFLLFYADLLRMLKVSKIQNENMNEK